MTRPAHTVSVHESRRLALNVAMKVRGFGAKTKLAQDAGWEQSYVSHLLKGTRSISDETARRIVAALGLDDLALDPPDIKRAQAQAARRADPAILLRTAEIAIAVSRRCEPDMSSRGFAFLMQHCFERYVETGVLTEDIVAELFVYA